MTSEQMDMFRMLGGAVPGDAATDPRRPDPLPPAPQFVPRPTLSDADLKNRFTYHPARDEDAKNRHARVSELTLNLAREIRDLCYPGRCLAQAIAALELVRMHANQSIACDDPRP